ncbi:MAG TPA: tetratricopeptide repeat protein [Planctomycetota bacterium]|nr:tetratricopeptide repeat protein [Planctomycetota bacterium]
MFHRGKKRVRREPDAFQKTFGGLLEHVRGSGMLLIILLVGALVAVAALWVASSRRMETEAAAQSKLAAALEHPAPADRLTAVRKLAEESPDTRAGALALWTEAILLHEQAIKGAKEENLREALQKIDAFLAKNPGHLLTPQALERRALVLEDTAMMLRESGKTDEAARTFASAAQAFEQAAKAVVDTDRAYLRGRLLYGQARCQTELKQTEQAVQTLEQALKAKTEDRGDPWRPAASALLAQLRPASRDLRLKATASDETAPAAPKPAAGGPGKDAPKDAPKAAPGDAGKGG